MLVCLCLAIFKLLFILDLFHPVLVDWLIACCVGSVDSVELYTE